MFNFLFRPYVPGFRVRLQDDVPGFDIDENSLPRPETTWPDEIRPGPVTPQDPDAVQTPAPHTTRFPTRGPEIQSAPPIGLAGFGVRPQDDVPGFNVRPQDNVPRFNLDKNGAQRQERIGFGGMRPGSATPQYSDTAQTLAPPPGVENPEQSAPPQLPEGLYKLVTMSLPSLSNAFDPVSGRRIVPYAPLINPVRFYPTTDQNVRGMGDTRADVLQTTPPPAPGTVEGHGTEPPPSFDVPKPLADIGAPYGTAMTQNFDPGPAWQEAMESRWPLPSDDGPPSEQGNVASPQELSGSGMAQQATGESPAPAVGPAADSNFVLANADGDEVQEAQQTQQPGRNTPTPVQQRPSAQGRPGASRQPAAPLREKSGEDLMRLAESRREEALNEARYKVRREERAPYWDYMLRALPIPNRLPTLKSPAFPDDRIQKPLSPDWRADVRKINPSYLDYTEAAAKKHGIPPELLGRLLYRESNYENRGVDSKGNRLRDRAVGIPQMYPGALKDVGVDPETFGRAGAAAQIDAGAAYLAQQHRRFGDWPRAVAAYHFGFPRIEAWLAGKAPTYENTTQRKNEESADFRGKTEKARKGQKEGVEDREAEAEKRAKNQMDQWAELQAYLPYIFLGDPSRYDRSRNP
jgi:Transglycosylase SLT domain